MKATGVIRRVDELGRIVIPREIIGTLDIRRKVKGGEDGEPMEIFVDGEQIILKKYNPGCQFCGSLEDVHIINNTKICKKCAKEISKVVK